MFKIICILAFCEFCFLILALLYSLATGTETQLNAIKLLYQLAAMLIVWFSEALGRRFKNHHDSMIALSLLAISILCVWATDWMVKFDDAGLIQIMKLFGYMIWWTQLLAPSIHFLLFYSGVFSVCLTAVVLRHNKEQVIIIGFGVIILISYSTFWYLLQQRELKRFYQQQAAENKEIKAVKKELAVTNVLNLQQNAVIIFSQPEEQSRSSNS